MTSRNIPEQCKSVLRAEAMACEHVRSEGKTENPVLLMAKVVRPLYKTISYIFPRPGNNTCGLYDGGFS